MTNNDETVADILTELNTIHDKPTKCCENIFITKAMEKSSVDLNDRFTKQNETKFIIDSLVNLINRLETPVLGSALCLINGEITRIS